MASSVASTGRDRGGAQGTRQAGPAVFITGGAVGWASEEDPVNRDLFEALAAQPPGSAARLELRQRLIEYNLPRATCLARRFQDRGESVADLEQVAVIGLIQAVDRFDPQRAVPFGGFLVPTVVGELKRHFRDRGWDIRVPRRLQELKASVAQATADLTAELSRAPLTSELAFRLGVSPQEVVEGRLAAQAYESVTLDSSFGSEQRGDGHDRQEMLGGPDEDLERIPDLLAMRQMVRQLPRGNSRSWHCASMGI